MNTDDPNNRLPPVHKHTNINDGSSKIRPPRRRRAANNDIGGDHDITAKVMLALALVFLAIAAVVATVIFVM